MTDSNVISITQWVAATTTSMYTTSYICCMIHVKGGRTKKKGKLQGTRKISKNMKTGR